jgi:Na+/H+ antiporter NhaD/arsenite permease-like protein
MYKKYAMQGFMMPWMGRNEIVTLQGGKSLSAKGEPMKARKAFYKKHVAKSIRVMMALFIVSYLLMFGIVLYDSFIHHLPFHYILFFLVGLAISIVYRVIQRLHWNEEAQKIVRKRDVIGLILSIGLFVVLMLIRKCALPEMLRAFNIVYVSDAIFVTMMGIFFGRVHTMAKQIEEIVFGKMSKDVP